MFILSQVLPLSLTVPDYARLFYLSVTKGNEIPFALLYMRGQVI